MRTVGARDRTQNAILARNKVFLKKCFVKREAVFPQVGSEPVINVFKVLKLKVWLSMVIRSW